MHGHLNVKQDPNWNFKMQQSQLSTSKLVTLYLFHTDQLLEVTVP